MRESQIHIDRALTDLTLGYTNLPYVGDQVFPNLPVNDRTGIYWTYRKQDVLNRTRLDANGRPLSLRTPRTGARERNYEVNQATYTARQYALREAVSVEEIADSDSPLMPAADATMNLTNDMLLDNELAIAGKACDPDNYPTANKTLLVSGVSSWGDGFDFLATLETAKTAVLRSSLRPANRALVNIGTAAAVKQNSHYQDAIKYVSRDVLIEGKLAPTINGLLIVEAQSQFDANADSESHTVGQTDVWIDQNDSSDICLVYHFNPNPGKKVFAFGYAFDAPDPSTGAKGLSVRRWFDEEKEVEWVQVAFTRTWEFIGVDGSSLSTGGYLISGTTL